MSNLGHIIQDKTQYKGHVGQKFQLGTRLALSLVEIRPRRRKLPSSISYRSKIIFNKELFISLFQLTYNRQMDYASV